MTTSTRTPECSNCASRMIPCMFGYPSAELLQMAARGEVKLMGCVRRGDPPSHYCPLCKAYHRHGERSEPAEDSRI